MPSPPGQGRRYPHARRAFAVALLVALLLPLALPRRSAVSAPRYELSDFERQVVEIVNAERRARGLATLLPDRRLWDAAEKHAEWMATNRRLSHTGSGGSTLATRAWAEGYRYTALGEVLARGQRSPEEVVRGRACDRWCSTICDSSRRCDGWKQSPGHWSIITSSRYRDLGVAYVPGPSDLPHWWGILFGNSNDPTQVLELGVGTPTPTATGRPLPSSTARPSATPRPTRPPAPTATLRAPEPSPTPAGSEARLLGQVALQGRADASGVFVLAGGRLVAITAADGRFQISRLPAGVVELRVLRPGWLPGGGSWRLAAGQRLDLGPTLLLAGDIDLDGRVDFDDYRSLLATYGRCKGSDRFDDRADFDGDGCVRFGDFGLFYGNYGRSGPMPW